MLEAVGPSHERAGALGRRKETARPQKGVLSALAAHTGRQPPPGRAGTRTPGFLTANSDPRWRSRTGWRRHADRPEKSKRTRGQRQPGPGASGPARPRPRDPAPPPPPATPPPRTYSARGSAPPASRPHSNPRSLSAAEAVSPPLLPPPLGRCRAPRLAMASWDERVEAHGHPTERASTQASRWLADGVRRGTKDLDMRRQH